MILSGITQARPRDPTGRRSDIYANASRRGSESAPERTSERARPEFPPANDRVNVELTFAPRKQPNDTRTWICRVSVCGTSERGSDVVYRVLLRRVRPQQRAARDSNDAERCAAISTGRAGTSRGWKSQAGEITAAMHFIVVVAFSLLLFLSLFLYFIIIIVIIISIKSREINRNFSPNAHTLIGME